jgi:hypothetical protein
VRIGTLAIGAREWSGVSALADDYSWVARPGEQPVMGLVGFPLVEHGLLTIDYPGQSGDGRDHQLAGEGQRHPYRANHLRRA